MLRVLSLFAGIGGFDLGLERTGGFKTVAFCEIDSFCRRVLAKHWPEVPCYDDVRTLTAERLAADGIEVDVICGGFPCQDISTAGAGAGIEGERSGLWSEYARLVGELRPSFVIVENVAALLARGLDKVLGDLAALGYDAEWDCIPAAAVGAPHRRDRLWLVAYPADSVGHFIRIEPRWISRPNRADTAQSPEHGEKRALADSESVGRGQGRPGRAPTLGEMRAAKGRALADTTRLLARRKEQRALGERVREGSQPIASGGWWLVEPDVGRVAHGVPARVDRLRSLGNAVVPQIPELIGCALLRILADLQPLHNPGNQGSDLNGLASPVRCAGDDIAGAPGALSTPFHEAGNR